MRIWKIRLAVLGCALGLTGSLSAKGLDELADANPEAAADDASTAHEADQAAGAPAASDDAAVSAEKAAIEPGPASIALADKLFMGTSFGWVKVSKKSGEWKGSGMSDFTVGYKLPFDLGESLNMAATYRYAPIAVSGKEDKRFYRGVWETHHLGSRLLYKVNPALNAIGTVEAGYAAIYLQSVDGLDTLDKHENNGGTFTVGGGADFLLAERGAFSAGPRLYAGFGQVTSFQLSAAASYLF